MLDTGHTGEDRRLEAVAGVGMRHDPSAKSGCFGNRRGEFVHAELRRADRITDRENATRGHDLDLVRTVLDVGADLLANRVGPVNDGAGSGDGQKRAPSIHIGMSAGAPQCRS